MITNSPPQCSPCAVLGVDEDANARGQLCDDHEAVTLMAAGYMLLDAMETHPPWASVGARSNPGADPEVVALLLDHRAAGKVCAVRELGPRDAETVAWLVSNGRALLEAVDRLRKERDVERDRVANLRHHLGEAMQRWSLFAVEMASHERRAYDAATEALKP